MRVEVKNGNLEHALRTLKRKLRSEGVIRELREREAFEKPGDERRRKHAQAVNRRRRADKREKLIAESSTVALEWWATRGARR